MFVACCRFVPYRRRLVENVRFVLLIRRFVFLANQAIHTLTFNKREPSQTCLHKIRLRQRATRVGTCLSSLTTFVSRLFEDQNNFFRGSDGSGAILSFGLL